MTKVGDLAAQDMKKVHRLALIEMTALFDTAGIDLKPQKALKLKVKGQIPHLLFLGFRFLTIFALKTCCLPTCH